MTSLESNLLFTEMYCKRNILLFICFFFCFTNKSEIQGAGHCEGKCVYEVMSIFGNPGTTIFSVIHKNVKGTNSTLRYWAMTFAEVSEKWLLYSESRIFPGKQNLVETILLSSLL